MTHPVLASVAVVLQGRQGRGHIFVDVLSLGKFMFPRPLLREFLFA